MLTTIDNPYDPRTEYTKWMQWDQEHGYFTAEYIASLCSFSNEMDDAAMDKIIQQAQMEIMEADELGIYKLVGGE